MKEASQRRALYVAIGSELIHYDVDIDRAELLKRTSVELPADIQYAWQHTSRQYFYVATSDRRPSAIGTPYYVSAFRINAVSGQLSPHGEPVTLRHRAVHLTTDIPSDHLLIAHNNPSGLTVHRLNGDGTIGDEVPQPGLLDAGIYAHQIRIAPDNAHAILVARGNDARPDKPEDPGALKFFKYRKGKVHDGVSIAPNGGYGFGPRHLDFHPSQPWVYVSLERQHKLQMFMMSDSALSAEPLYSKETLLAPANVRPRQLAGTVHVHPNGRFVYEAERCEGTREANGKKIFGGGENHIAVYAIDERTGEHNLVQCADTRGVHPRTFTIDPDGRLLIAANKSPILVGDGESTKLVPASLSLFRIRHDGQLDYVRTYDVEVGSASMYWAGVLPL